MSVVSATTLLEAVNVLLATIGESPLDTLTGQLHVDAIIAQNTITAVLKEVQLEGWHFNVEDDYPLTPDMDGYITLPENVFNIDLSHKYTDYDVVIRNGKLYNKKEHTFVFTEPLEASLTFVFPFEDIPESLRNYIIIRAARRFQEQVVGSETLYKFNSRDEAYARATFVSENCRNEDLNYLDPLNTFLGRRSITTITRRR